MTVRKAIRQGDILLVPVETRDNLPPADPKFGRVVLAEGEVTGHHHSFAIDPAVKLFHAGHGDLVLELEDEKPLEHQEHAVFSAAEDIKAPGGQVIRKGERFRTTSERERALLTQALAEGWPMQRAGELVPAGVMNVIQQNQWSDAEEPVRVLD